MGELILDATMNGMISRNRIEAADVLALRQSVYRDGVVEVAEAEKIFALDRSCQHKDASWAEFLVEALTDYLVYQESPRGYVSEENAKWLVSSISADGVVDGETELALLLKVMKTASSVPPSLSAFALSQVAHAVLDSTGVLANGRAAKPGVVIADDVEMLKTVLYAGGGDAGLSISREEAEVLFEINDRTAKADNDPSWTALFSRAVASALMVATGYIAPDRAEAKRREDWLNDTSTDIGGFYSRIFAGGLRAMADRIMSDKSVEGAHGSRNATAQEANALAERIDGEEAKWLADRIMRDGELHENEVELLRFIKREADHIHPALEPLMARVAV